MVGLLVVLGALWSIPWKGLALWHAARDGHTRWFILLLVVNTLGVLEILYLYRVRRRIRGAGFRI